MTLDLMFTNLHFWNSATDSFLTSPQDYKTYLDFVLALENRKEPAALQYIFKLLDMDNKGYLNVFALNYFFRVSNVNPILIPYCFQLSGLNKIYTNIV